VANEELTQRGYLAGGVLRGTKFGELEELNIGGTTIRELAASGVELTVPAEVAFPFKSYKPPKAPGNAKPGRVFLRRLGSQLCPVAAGEHKAPTKLRSAEDLLKAAEQVLFYTVALAARVGFTSNGERWHYIDVQASLARGEIVYFPEARDLNPAVLVNLLQGDAAVAKNPRPLAETVWQIIWLATKEEPKQCLLTFVEIFILKFLSDNLPKTSLPDAYSVYTLLKSPEEFQGQYGKTAIAYYVSDIRPQIKKLFPDNEIVQDPDLPRLFGLATLVSKTSIINGFAFLKSSEESVDSFNRTFLQILQAFHQFGPLTAIDPEFKLRLYETFLKSTSRQQRLGQFFTPRNVVRPMIQMARLGTLPDGAVVLDPAAGVGGFILEPMLIENALPNNLTFAKGKATRRVKTVGLDLDLNTNILAKANLLIHLAEEVRNPTSTLQAMNKLMAETFIMSRNETLGSLENPPKDSIDVILTNPPYVTQGSKVYREEIADVKGRRNGLDLRDYYDRRGMGVESLFLRYICGALKPGGRAFVIVPLGMLNRTDPGPKSRPGGVRHHRLHRPAPGHLLQHAAADLHPGPGEAAHQE
jgi:type I restriction enzyme M protein